MYGKRTDSDQTELELKPGRKVAVTIDGREAKGQLLHPVHAGCPGGLWWVLFDNGMADAFKLEEMGAAK